MPDEIKPAPLLLAESATVYATADAFGQEQGNATAHLIAAAKDLLAACERARDTIANMVAATGGRGLNSELLLEIDATLYQQIAAIAKAKGGAE